LGVDIGLYMDSAREVFGILKSEMKTIRDTMSVYQSQSKLLMLRKLMSSPMIGIATWLIESNRRTLRLKTSTFWGDKIGVVIPESGSVSIANSGVLEPPLTKLMLQYIQNEMTTLDIGAHFGYYTLLMSHLVGPAGQVHAFEPTPSTFSVLLSNVRNLPNVVANRVACSSKRGTAFLSEYGFKFSGFNTLAKPRMKELGRGKPVEVQTLRVDDYVTSRGIKPDFIKIDAEGTEGEILNGMENVIRSFHPMISLEVGDFVTDAIPSRELIEHLLAMNYVAFEYRNGVIAHHRARRTYGYDNILLVPTNRLD